MKSLTVLVVDDNSDFLEMLDVGLQLRGYQVIAFSNPTDAISIFKSEESSFDVVVTDWIMDGVTGQMIVDAATSMSKPCPVIVMSGLSDSADVQKSELSKAGALVTKPVTPKQLDELIQHLVNH